MAIVFDVDVGRNNGTLAGLLLLDKAKQGRQTLHGIVKDYGDLLGQCNCIS